MHVPEEIWETYVKPYMSKLVEVAGVGRMQLVGTNVEIHSWFNVKVKLCITDIPLNEGPITINVRDTIVEEIKNKVKEFFQRYYTNIKNINQIDSMIQQTLSKRIDVTKKSVIITIINEYKDIRSSQRFSVENNLLKTFKEITHNSIKNRSQEETSTFLWYREPDESFIYPISLLVEPTIFAEFIINNPSQTACSEPALTRMAEYLFAYHCFYYYSSYPLEDIMYLEQINPASIILFQLHYFKKKIKEALDMKKRKIPFNSFSKNIKEMREYISKELNFSLLTQRTWDMYSRAQKRLKEKLKHASLTENDIIDAVWRVWRKEKPMRDKEKKEEKEKTVLERCIRLLDTVRCRQNKVFTLALLQKNIKQIEKLMNIQEQNRFKEYVGSINYLNEERMLRIYMIVLLLRYRYIIKPPPSSPYEPSPEQVIEFHQSIGRKLAFKDKKKIEELLYEHIPEEDTRERIRKSMNKNKKLEENRRR